MAHSSRIKIAIHYFARHQGRRYSAQTNFFDLFPPSRKMYVTLETSAERRTLLQLED